MISPANAAILQRQNNNPDQLALAMVLPRGKRSRLLMMSLNLPFGFL
jgi:hypothetical protein